MHIGPPAAPRSSILVRSWRPVVAFAALAVAAWPAAARAQRHAAESSFERVTVSLVTVGSGAAPLTWLGHSALLVRGPQRGVTTLVDYGAIEGGPGVLARALSGRLRAVVRLRDGDRALAAFARDGRSVSVLGLQLHDEEVRTLLRLVETDVATARGRYVYRYDRDNCATRLRDHLDAALGGRLRRSGGSPATETLRAHGLARVYPRNAPVALLGDVVMNGDVDGRATTWTLAAQPAGLQALVRATTTDSAGVAVPLAVEAVAPARGGIDEPVGTPPPRGAIAAIGALVAALALGAARSARSARGGRIVLGALGAITAVVLGVPGLLIAAGWTLTEYAFVRGNENLLLANPLALLLLPAAIAFAAGSSRAGRWLHLGWRALAALAVAALALKLVPGFEQDNGRVLALAVPLTLGLAAAFGREARAPHPARSALTTIEARA